LKNVIGQQILDPLNCKQQSKNRLTQLAIGWKTYPIRVICKHMFLTYDDASNFANTTLAISSSESDAPVVKNAPTKRKKQNQIINYNSSSTDEEQSAVKLPNFPVFTGNIFYSRYVKYINLFLKCIHDLQEQFLNKIQQMNQITN